MYTPYANYARRQALGRQGGAGAWFTDFSEGVGNWSDQWNPFGSYAAVADEEAEGGFQWLQAEGGASDRNFLRWDTVPPLVDCRVRSRVLSPWESISFNFQLIGVAVRAAGSAGSETGYAAQITTASSGGRRRFQLWKWDDGNSSLLGQVNANLWTPGVFVNVDLQVIGADLEARIWNVGDERPESPGITHTDSAPLAAGSVGLVNTRATAVSNGIAADIFGVEAL